MRFELPVLVPIYPNHDSSNRPGRCTEFDAERYVEIGVDVEMERGDVEFNP